MQTVNLDDAKAHLIDLVDAASRGEEVIIRKDDETYVQLVPRIPVGRARRFGSAKGLIEVAPGFDKPLPEFDDYR
jgi:antitoxin (DNA-binding transcriptional repressor) of toxin-antitoxin stability system